MAILIINNFNSGTYIESYKDNQVNPLSVVPVFRMADRSGQHTNSYSIYWVSTRTHELSRYARYVHDNHDKTYYNPSTPKFTVTEAVTCISYVYIRHTQN